MQSVFSYESFRSFLTDEFAQRTKRNGLYSLRAFARDLNMSHSRLSEFLSKKSPISARSGQTICKALSLAQEECAYLIDLIQCEFHPNESVRASAREAAKQKRQTRLIVSKGDGPDLLENWYDLSLIVFLTLPRPMPMPEVAERLGLDEKTVTEAAGRLERAAFIERDGAGWKKSHAFVKFESGVPSPHYKAYHEAFLRLSANALQTHPIPERKFVTWVFSFNDSELEQARNEIEEFAANFVRKYADRETSDRVYSLGLQFYQLGNPRKT
jgi:uncharacterized protein (TIGR02147 family)